MERTSRRRFVAGIGALSIATVGAGCSGSGSSTGDGNSNGTGSGGNDGSGEATTGGNGGSGGTSAGGTATDGAATSGGSTGGGKTVAAGPNGKLVFEPKQIEVSVGDTVTWEFESAGHNVSARPQDGDKVSIPDGAKPFASYDNGKTYAVVSEGETYEYTFETPGDYTYVCIPHASSGMVGTVTVSE
jgi:plastocyanin